MHLAGENRFPLLEVCIHLGPFGGLDLEPSSGLCVSTSEALLRHLCVTTSSC